MKVMIAYYRYRYTRSRWYNYGKDYSSSASDRHYYHHKVDHDYVRPASRVSLAINNNRK